MMDGSNHCCLSVETLLASLLENEAVISFSLDHLGRVIAYETRCFYVPLYDLNGELVMNMPNVAATLHACVLRGRQ